MSYMARIGTDDKAPSAFQMLPDIGLPIQRLLLEMLVVGKDRLPY